MPSTSAPTHVTESMSDRRKTRELAEARQSGAVAPEVDVKTGSMINPHNPEFITRRPWYLGGNDAGPSLDHQADQRTEAEKIELSLSSADKLIREERDKIKRARKSGQFKVGMWVEALKKGRKPYLICQVVKIAKKGTEYDLKYEDGAVERKVKFRMEDREKSNPRIRMTKTGSRSFEVDHATFGKETYDSKRDSYHGYEVSENHMKRIEERFSKRDAIRRKQRSKTVNGDKETDKGGDKPSQRGGRDTDSDSDSDYDSDEGSDSDDEFVQRDEDAKTFTSRLARQGGVGGAQMKVTARNLRIREDTAKYLRNLDPNSAYYDPKSRSMRDNPNPDVNPDELQYAGDNFVRISGDAVGLADTQLFAWEASDKGVSELHPQANPSQAELLKKQFKTKSADLKVQRKKAVLDKYGGREYLDGEDGLGGASGEDETAGVKVDKETAEERKVRFGSSVVAEEYTRDGRLVKGGTGGTAPKLVPLTSKYEEDIYINGHSTVWGSYFHRGGFRWGYADDHSLMKNSYCTGPNGRVANDEANEMRYGTGVTGSAEMAQAREMLKAIPQEQRNAKSSTVRPMGSKMYGEANQHVDFDKEKLAAAMKKLEDGEKNMDERKRKYNSMNANNDVTEEEMEAYRLRKGRADDPMAKLADSGELLEYK